jgi:hypothetical protein
VAGAVPAKVEVVEPVDSCQDLVLQSPLVLVILLPLVLEVAAVEQDQIQYFLL